jgi:hypothetical protein
VFYNEPGAIMMTIRRLRGISILCLGLALLLPAQDRTAPVIKLKVSAEQANLREKPDIGSAIVQQIPEGTLLEADKKDGEWYLVRYTLEDGGVIAGFIHESLVTVLDQGREVGIQPGRETKPETERRPGSGPQKLPWGEREPAGSKSLLPIDLFISAGGTTVIADDFNKSARGLADFNGASLAESPSGSIHSLRLTYVLSFEVAYRISRWVSIGLGADYQKGWRSSRVYYQGVSIDGLLIPSMATATRPSVEVVPAKLSLRFYPRPDFYIRATAAYYTVKAGYDDTFVSSADTWQEWRGRATAHALGMEVAVGGEWSLKPSTLFFAEAGFRLAHLSGFEGTGTFRDSAGTDTSETGPLWFYQQRDAFGFGQNLLFIHASEPTGSDILSARKATLNLTGTTVRAGIKFRF